MRNLVQISTQLRILNLPDNISDVEAVRIAETAFGDLAQIVQKPHVNRLHREVTLVVSNIEQARAAVRHLQDQVFGNWHFEIDFVQPQHVPLY
jgi:hypothetical protein